MFVGVCACVCVCILPGQGKAGVTKANKHSFHWLCDVDPGFLPMLPVRIEPNYPPSLVRLGATCRQSAGQMDGLPSKLAQSSWARTQFECKTKRNDEAEDELLQGGTGHDDVGSRRGVVPAEAVNVRPSLCRTLVPCTIYGTIYYFMSEERNELVDRSLSQPNPSTQTP